MNNFTNIPVEILELLPWYVTNKLSKDERDLFETALEMYPELRKQLELEEQMVILVSDDESILDKRILEAPEERLKLVFNQIDNPKAIKKERPSNVCSLVDRLKKNVESTVANEDKMTNYARVASVGVLVLSVATLKAFITPLYNETSDFIPASAAIEPSSEQISEASTTKAKLLVGFSGTIDQLKDNDSLKNKLMTIESAPDNEGIFQINFKQEMNATEIQQTIDSLQAQEDAVWFVGEAD